MGMKILLTGASGYIGRRLLPVLMEQRHEVTCCVRGGDPFGERYPRKSNLETIEIDFLNREELQKLPKDIDVAFFLMHSMSSATKGFDTLENTIATHFNEYIKTTRARQVIYLSGLVPSQGEISMHLQSRWEVEKILAQSGKHLTVLRAGIVVGSGSASFEIIRDLVEKLPFMIAPKWLNNRCQPVSIRNVIQFLTGVMGKSQFYDRTFDIGGSDILTYREMLLGYAQVRKLRRVIWIVPIMTPKLSSYWLFFISKTPFKLAMNLVESMKSDLVCRNNDLANKLNIKTIPYIEAIKLAFARIEQNMVISSWKDAVNEPELYSRMNTHIQVPTHGCLRDQRVLAIGKDCSRVIDNIWALGGDKGWYYGNWLWQIRGMIDRMVGGVGLRRGRTDPQKLHPGDALDFWRVLIADREDRRLLLFAEMKLPGEGWLEYKIDETDQGFQLKQTATFRPYGIRGRIYWYLMLPIHLFMFSNMAKSIATK